MSIKEVSLDTIADGSALDLFQHELMNVCANIMDPNTSATGKRKIVLEFELAPDDSRDEVKTTVSVKSTLQPIKGYSKTLYTGKKDGKPSLYQQDQKQTDMFSEGVTPLSQAVNHG